MNKTLCAHCKAHPLHLKKKKLPHRDQSLNLCPQVPPDLPFWNTWVPYFCQLCPQKISGHTVTAHTEIHQIRAILLVGALGGLRRTLYLNLLLCSVVVEPAVDIAHNIDVHCHHHQHPLVAQVQAQAHCISNTVYAMTACMPMDMYNKKTALRG